MILLKASARENFLELDPESESRSRDEPKLFTEDGGVGGGVNASACWVFGGKRGRADVASGRASSARRKKKRNSFMVASGTQWLEREV